jgi:predicted transcriptional regulator
MPRGNPAPKLAITVDPEVHARVLEAAEAEGLSVSAWMTKAARHALRASDGVAAIAEWEAENGVLTEEELQAARDRIAQRETARPSPARVMGPRRSAVNDNLRIAKRKRAR